MNNSCSIIIDVLVNNPIEKVWHFWSAPEHITKWNFASDEWECPAVENDFRAGGKFSYVMAAKDGSAEFNFEGIYTKIEQYDRIEYVLDDQRKVSVKFISEDSGTRIIESFEAEGSNCDEQQRLGWQAILENFKKYAERNHE